MLVSMSGTIKIMSSTVENYTNLQSLPNAIWQNLTQNETTITHTVVVYHEAHHEAHRHGYESTYQTSVFPLSFD